MASSSGYGDPYLIFKALATALATTAAAQKAKATPAPAHTVVAPHPRASSSRSGGGLNSVALAYAAGKSAKATAPKSSSGPSGLLGHLAHVGAGLATNLATDTYNAATGTPAGIVETVEHPVTAAKLMGKSAVHDWAPLFTGHPGEFVHQTYEHPLAPILDAATVFSVGAGSAAKAADVAGTVGEALRGTEAASDAEQVGNTLARAGDVSAAPTASSSESLLSKVAKLGKPTNRVVVDAKSIAEGANPREALIKTYRGNAGANLRRAVINKVLQKAEPVLPDSMKAAAREGRLYNRMAVAQKYHYVAATNHIIDRTMRGAEQMDDPVARELTHPAVLQNIHENMINHSPVFAEGKLPENYSWVRSRATAPYAADDRTLAERVNNKSFGKDFTTNNVADAEPVITRNGTFYHAIAKPNAANLLRNAQTDASFLTKVLPNATKLWKKVQVGYDPRVLTNVGIGNWFLYALKNAGKQFSGRAIVDAVKMMHGDAAAFKAFKDMHATIKASDGPEAAARFTAMAHPALLNEPDIAAIEQAFGKRAAQAVQRPGAWMHTHFADQLGTSLGNILSEGTDATKVARNPIKKFGQSGFYPLVHRLSDVPVRTAAIYQYLRSSPEVQTILKSEPGTTLDTAISRALKRNPDLRDRAASVATDIAGDYHTLGKAAGAVQSIVPFYQWDKHIARSVGSLASESPARLAITQQSGDLGDQERDKLLGAVPDFMSSALPLSMLGAKGSGDRTPILLTSGMNPLQTYGDLARVAGSLTTDPNSQHMVDSAGELSPVLTDLIQQITGKRLGTEAPVARHGGLVGSTLADLATGTSYGTLISRLIHGTPKPKDTVGQSFTKKSTAKPFLYSKTPSSYIESLLGFPIRNVSLTRAHQMADEESGTKTTVIDPFTGKRVKKGGF